MFVILLSCFFIPVLTSSDSVTFSYTPPTASSFFSLEDNGFLWPCPGYTHITSPFGKRKAPTAGASTSHSGVDIGVPTGTPLLAITSGTVTMAEFNGAGGCTVTFKHKDYTFSYCHVSPNYLVQVGDNIKQGQVIAHVGPKNVYGIWGNPYKDSNGNPTNGATTGAHLHLTVRKNGSLINPLTLFS